MRRLVAVVLVGLLLAMAQCGGASGDNGGKLNVQVKVVK